MKQLVDGVFNKGHIDIDFPLPLDDNTKVKVLIMTNDTDETLELGTYKLGKSLDDVNMRDFAHED